MTTKKVKKTGKFGIRYGVGIRKKFLLATTVDEKKYVCPVCGNTNTIKRKALGIYKCKKCGAEIAGGAYKLKTRKLKE